MEWTEILRQTMGCLETCLLEEDPAAEPSKAGSLPAPANLVINLRRTKHGLYCGKIG